MTPEHTSALPHPGARRPAPRGPTPPTGLPASPRLAARRQRVRTIRRWVGALAVTLFIVLATVIGTSTKSTSAASSTAGGGKVSSSSGGSSGSASASASASKSAYAAATPVTSGQS